MESVANIFSEAIDLLTCYSIPLYIDEKARPLHIGTGFFVNYRTDCYLVSAAHVLDIAVSHQMYFYSTTQQKRHLDGRLIRSKSLMNRATDRVDIGVLKLGPSERPPYPEVSKFPMDISYLRPNYLPRVGKEYSIIGFPCSKNGFRVHKSDVLTAPYAYRSQSIPSDNYQRLGLSVETHVVLPLDLKNTVGPSGKRIHFPNPKGMSGAPILVLYEDSPNKLRVFPVVAVGIEYRSNEKVLVATDVRFVLEAIAEAA